MLMNYQCGPNATLGPSGACYPVKPQKPPKGWKPSIPPKPNVISYPATGQQAGYSDMQIAANSAGISNQDKLVVYSYFDWAELPAGDPNSKNAYKILTYHVKTAKKALGKAGKSYDPLIPINTVLRQMGMPTLSQLPSPADKLRPKGASLMGLGESGIGIGTIAIAGIILYLVLKR